MNVDKLTLAKIQKETFCLELAKFDEMHVWANFLDVPKTA